MLGTGERRRREANPALEEVVAQQEQGRHITMDMCTELDEPLPQGCAALGGHLASGRSDSL